MRRPRTWFLVADGSRARPVFESGNEATGSEPVYRAERRRMREAISGLPGRSYASVGRLRSAMEAHSDPVREDERGIRRYAGEATRRPVESRLLRSSRDCRRTAHAGLDPARPFRRRRRTGPGRPCKLGNDQMTWWQAGLATGLVTARCAAEVRHGQ